MRAVDPLSAYLAETIVQLENSVEPEATVFRTAVSALKAKPEYADLDEFKDEIPDRLYEIVGMYCSQLINRSSIAAYRQIIKLVNTLADDDAEKDMATLAEKARELLPALAYTMHITQHAIEVVDFDHVGELCFEAGRKRAMAESVSGK